MTLAMERRTTVPVAAPLKFRDDINGLRAIAVTAVVLYHFKVGGLGGGYLGVDVFFVISGFLMTKIILSRLWEGRFSLFGFYKDRVRRIVPALIVLCLAVFAVAAFLIDPMVGETVGVDTLASATFWSNMLYATQGGYFGKGQDANWLIHTWSLSVEWQFYILYPVVLMLAHRLFARRATALAVIVLGAALSFPLAFLLSFFRPETVDWGFYLFPCRAWEMLAGGLCAYAGDRVPLAPVARKTLHGLGLTVILAACVLVNSHFSHQPLWIAIPVIATALVIFSGERGPTWAANPVTAAIGRWSYSIYLWHWPMVAGLAYWKVALTPPVIALAVAASVTLGALSYQVVEQRLTNWLFPKAPPSRWGMVVAGLAVVLALSAAVWRTHDFERLRTAGAPPTVVASLAEFRRASKDWRWGAPCTAQAKLSVALRLCYAGDPKARDTLVIGDSHVQQLMPRYARVYAPGTGITFATEGGCIPLPGVGRRQAASPCLSWINQAYRLAETAGYKRIIIGSLWTGYFDPEPAETVGPLCFQRGSRCVTAHDPQHYQAAAVAAFDRFATELQTLKAHGVDVSVIDPFPQDPEADPQQLYRTAFFTRALVGTPFSRQAFLDRTAMVRNLVEAAARKAGVQIIDPVSRLCESDTCSVISADGHALYKDQTHFRASAVTTPRFAFLDQWLKP